MFPVVDLAKTEYCIFLHGQCVSDSPPTKPSEDSWILYIRTLVQPLAAKPDLSEIGILGFSKLHLHSWV